MYAASIFSVTNRSPSRNGCTTTAPEVPECDPCPEAIGSCAPHAATTSATATRTRIPRIRLMPSTLAEFPGSAILLREVSYLVR
ncbi:hypothetical protein GCM10010160_10830 [Acrocarpospora corrugata]